MTPEQRHELFISQHKRKPATISTAPQTKQAPGGQNTNATVPADARFPGEFEEVEGVFISWPYFWTSQTTAFIDTLINSDYSDISSKLAEAIQAGNAKVFINVWTGADSSAVKRYMTAKGRTLTNYRFMVYDGDDVWARDFGPVTYYTGSQDTRGWVDFKYYPGRDFDNVLPDKWGAELGIPVTKSGINYEGGNILTDGFNNLVTSSAVDDLNAYVNGLTPAQVKDSLQNIYKGGRVDVVPTLVYDGGTGHVDLYLSRMDENTYVYTKYPEDMNISSFSDFGTASNNLDTLRGHPSAYNKTNKFRTLPLPPKDDGTWYATGKEYNDTYTRTYSNNLVVNKVVVQPIFHDATSGYVAADNAALDSLKLAYPGYTFYQIDMRPYDGSGGSIHCITKELPADNPLRIFHAAYANMVAYQSNYPVDVTITNKSGISAASLYWRRKGTTPWNQVTLTAGSNNHWLGQIPGSTKTIDSFEYYINASSVNGKTMSKPMTAPTGYYTFWYDKNFLSVPTTSQELVDLGNIYPNPSKGIVNIEVIPAHPAQITMQFVDISGKSVLSRDYGTVSSRHYLQADLSMLPVGVYMMQVSVNGSLAFTRRVLRN
jgi:agmatine/peptidylarginine deiminase